MNGAGVKLHPENHISARTSVALVIALELEKRTKNQITAELNTPVGGIESSKDALTIA